MTTKDLNSVANVATLAAVPREVQGVGLAARAADAAADWRDGVEQGQELGDVVAVGASEVNRQRDAMPVGDQVVFGAGPAAVDRRRARVDPPLGL